MAAPRPTAQLPARDAQETLSQLIARILDQLSVSAWLPAAALVFTFLLVGSLRHADGDLDTAIATIGDLDLAAFVLLLGAVILTTMLTQAFEFEAIRLFEGYWGTRRLPAGLAQVACGRHLARRRSLRRQLQEAEIRGVKAAQPALRRDGYTQAELDALLAIKTGQGVALLSAEQRRQAAHVPWMKRAPARPLREMEGIQAALREYPKAHHLVRPTKLGNTLRAREEALLPIAGGKLEGFVHRVWEQIPVAIQTEHDQFRSRLDLYCSLLLVFSVAGSLATALLVGFGTVLVAASATLTVLLSWLSYRAAIASARAYGELLTTIADITKPTPTSP